MEHDVQIQNFLEYLTVVEEGVNQLSPDQIKKLEIIKTRVSELVKKVQVQPVSTPAPQQINVTQPAMMENHIQSFNEFTEVNEMIKKSGSGFVVTNKSGKKVLGKHKTRKKALAQLQAIEISKAKHG